MTNYALDITTDGLKVTTLLICTCGWEKHFNYREGQHTRDINHYPRQCARAHVRTRDGRTHIITRRRLLIDRIWNHMNNHIQARDLTMGDKFRLPSGADVHTARVVLWTDDAVKVLTHTDPVTLDKADTVILVA